MYPYGMGKLIHLTSRYGGKARLLPNISMFCRLQECGRPRNKLYELHAHFPPFQQQH